MTTATYKASTEKEIIKIRAEIDQEELIANAAQTLLTTRRRADTSKPMP